MIETKDLKKIYPVGETATIALAGVTFSIEENEFVAIMGKSGSGKSTLLHILGFLDRHSEGEYLFDKKTFDVYTEEEVAHVRNKKMGFVFQSFNLLARTTVLDNVKLPLLYSDIEESRWEKLALDAIEKVGLSHRINHESSELSGGERQRVAIARAIINNPNIIFADEPTGNLDTKSGEQIMEIFEALHKEGHTIVLITHEDDIASYAERIITMKDGKIWSDNNIKKHQK
ncbi:MAG: macrolide ABC transporter ATP-binding protein [Parcubacteria group bacterium CG10_big_fil_rev_8_21_14_0_10_38_31]|nr:MAG: macrolide ABC transporter ATP-binding protein [Parcubacteria group bacterium CG10_big_fil_rev_8_21_14_0_10_38_31]